MDAILALIGSRWTTYLGMMAVGALVLFYPPFLAIILGWGLIGFGVSGIVRAYREGAFDDETAKIKETVAELRAKL